MSNVKKVSHTEKEDDGENLLSESQILPRLFDLCQSVQPLKLHQESKKLEQRWAQQGAEARKKKKLA